MFVADGLGFADALSITPVAALMGSPIIFTPNDKVGINSVSADYLSSYIGKKAVLVGGESVVKSDVDAKLKEMGFSTERVFGSDRYETSAKIYDKYKDLFSGDKAIMATGRDFPDALAGGVLGAKIKAPLLLVNGTGATSAPVKAAFNAMPARTDIYVLGGRLVVTDEVVNNHIK